MKKFLIIIALIFAKNVFALTCADVGTSAKQMTEAQFDEYTKTIEGATIECTGKVVEVDSKWLSSDYSVIVVNNTRVFFDMDKHTALSLRKRNNYQFIGKVRLVYTLFDEANIILHNVTMK